MSEFTYLGSNIGFLQRCIQSECIQTHKTSHKTQIDDYTTYYKVLILEVNSTLDSSVGEPLDGTQGRAPERIPKCGMTYLSSMRRQQVTHTIEEVPELHIQMSGRHPSRS